MEKRAQGMYNGNRLSMGEGDAILLFTPIPLSRLAWIDTGTHTASPLNPIAMDEALANAMSLPGARPAIHLWIYERALYLGRRDARLPRLEQALREMGRAGYGAVLRSSGGACVPLDAGVLNVAILLPKTDVSIDAFFQLAASLLEDGLSPYGTLQVGEVKGSYCVGDYDFALEGKKIGGMAQRRTRFGSILQLCINVEGSGRARGELMERFYRLAGLEEMAEPRPIPGIDADTIGSLSDQSGRPVTVAEVKQSLFDAVLSRWDAEPTAFPVAPGQVDAARQHLSERLQLFSYTAAELTRPEWRLPQ